jgi:hypothetical protein
MGTISDVGAQRDDVKNLFVADAGPFVSTRTRTARGRFSRCHATSEFITAAQSRDALRCRFQIRIQIADYGESMKPITRRAALELFAAAPAAAALADASRSAAGARTRRRARHKPARRSPKFFTAHEHATVGVPVDLIISRDERSAARPTPACRRSWTS